MQINYKGNRTKGIIQYFLDTYPDQYNDYVKTFSSAQFPSNNIIDRNKDTYWYGSKIIVYFPNHFADINAYMIQTSHGQLSSTTCYPWHWALDASNDNITWVHKEEIVDDKGYIRSAYGSVIIPWIHGPYK